VCICWDRSKRAAEIEVPGMFAVGQGMAGLLVGPVGTDLRRIRWTLPK